MMSRIAIFLIFVQFALVGFSQTVSDTLPKKKGSREIGEFDKKNYKSDPGDRMLIEILHTGYTGLPANIQQSSIKSIGVNFSLMFDKPIGKSAFSFGYGLGIFSHNFHSNAEFVYITDSTVKNTGTRLEPIQRETKLNRYAQKILEMPIEFRFRTKTDRQFKIHVGFRVGYMLNDFRSVQDKDGKFRTYRIKNINPVRYGATFRIGFQQFAFSASYYFSELFQDNKGPQGILPYSIGIAIIPY
ncbi:MAG: outer membrane beta-barrel protein [Sphingobacteriaceae bacterium]|nr:outer membrane beta-barrel protein [Sphingobacteriaceae bacterium]